MRGPSALLAACTVRIMQQGAARARTARASRAARAGPGDRGGTGGGQGVAAGGRRVAGARTAHWLAPPPSSRASLRMGFWGPHPGAVGPPRCVSVGWERQRPLAAMTHGAQGGGYDSRYAMMHAAGGRTAWPATKGAVQCKNAAGGRGGKAWTPTAYGRSSCQPGGRPSAAAAAHHGGVVNLRGGVAGRGCGGTLSTRGGGRQRVGGLARV